MSDFVPKPNGVRIGGLSRAAQKLLAAQEKARAQTNGGKHLPAAPGAALKAKPLAGTKKTSFQRKAV